MFCQAQVSAVFHDELHNNRDRREALWTLAGARLVCHCKLWQDCHGDVITEEHAQMHPDAGPVFTLHHQLQMSWTTWLVSEKSQRLTPGLLQMKVLRQQVPAGAAQASRRCSAQGTRHEKFAMTNRWPHRGDGHRMRENILAVLHGWQ